MHYRFLVTIPKEKAKDSFESRSYVNSWLEENGFTSGGRFGRGMADWYAIGGRWSGELTSVCLDKEKMKKVEEELGDHWFEGGKEHWTREKRLKQYEEVFRKYFPNFKGIIPAWRDQYLQEGYEDDAKIIDEDLWNNLMKEVIAEDDTEQFCDMEDELNEKTKKEDVIGKYWVVVVDYHS